MPSLFVSLLFPQNGLQGLDRLPVQADERFLRDNFGNVTTANREGGADANVTTPLEDQTDLPPLNEATSGGRTSVV